MNKHFAGNDTVEENPTSLCINGFIIRNFNFYKNKQVYIFLNYKYFEQ